MSGEVRICQGGHRGTEGGRRMRGGMQVGRMQRGRVASGCCR
jgi:hypothetical protein